MLRWLLLLAALTGCAPAAAGEGEATTVVSEEEQVRRSYLETWRELGSDGSSGLERFAGTVQQVVDTRAAMAWNSRDEAVRAVLDDLVDLFVGPEYGFEKRLVMSEPPLLGDDALSEDDDDLSGFAPRFREGEGRFRHFALNAAAAYAVPETFVALAARLRGRDLQSTAPENEGDRAADIATNRIGREFTRLLRQYPLAELSGGVVREWLVERFGDG